VGRECDRDCDPGIGERPGTDNPGLSRIGADDAGRAGCAVARGFELAEEVVVLERHRREEDGINHQPDECEAPSRQIRESLPNPAKAGSHVRTAYDVRVR
jgi:hypothetical protein